jgi:hypothetical protein
MSAPRYQGWAAVAVNIEAAGTDRDTAPRLTVGCLNVVTGANGTNAVALADKPRGGEQCRVVNNGDAPLWIHTTAGGSIGDAPPDVPVLLQPKRYAIYECIDGANWTGTI